MGGNAEQSQPIKPQLGLWDAVSIIIGIVIGSSIYQMPPTINGHLSGPGMTMVVWTLGGVLCLVGALCYAELATTYPRMGGDYYYLTRAFHPAAGFFFGWAQLAVILSGSIGMMGFVFGDYAVLLFGSDPGMAVWFAVAAIGLLTVTNILGVILSKGMQNVLSLTKVIGLGGIFVVGMLWGQPTATAWVDHAPTAEFPSFGTALILVLYAYGGWNDAAFVAADMKDRRTIPRTLILGTAGVMIIYLLVNAAYIQALGFAEAQKYRPTIAADVVQLGMGPTGAKVMSLLVMISALGAINGLLFTGSRVCSAMGSDHSIFAALGQWNRQLGSPVWALLALAAFGILLVFAVGIQAGRDTVDAGLRTVGLATIPWGAYYGGFNTLFAGTAPVFWFFFLLAGISLFVLRSRDPGIERPFKLQTPWYPLLPLIFCGMCVFGFYKALDYAKFVAFIGVVPLVIGIPLYFVSRHTPGATTEVSAEAPSEPTE